MGQGPQSRQGRRSGELGGPSRRKAATRSGRPGGLIVPVLPSAIDLEATQPFLAEVAALPRVKKGKVAVGLVANRLKPWTNASQLAVEEVKAFPFPLVAELRDTQGYVLANALGKSIFDYHSESVRSHQDDWAKLLRWLKKLA